MPAFGVLLVPLTAVVVLAAALSARRGGRMPTSILLLTAGDPTGAGILIVVAWAVGWALLAIVSVAVAVAGVVGRGARLNQVGSCGGSRWWWSPPCSGASCWPRARSPTARPNP